MSEIFSIGLIAVTAEAGSVNVVSAGLARKTSDGYTTTTSTDQQQSQLSAGTDATIKARDDILVAGSSLKAGGSANLEAGDDVNIVATQQRSDSTFGKNTASATSPRRATASHRRPARQEGQASALPPASASRASAAD
ncbi:hemagglutinin repeat-containing protein [Rhizobium sp. YTU87027]